MKGSPNVSTGQLFSNDLMVVVEERCLTCLLPCVLVLWMQGKMVDAASNSAALLKSDAIAIPQRTNLIQEEKEDAQAISASPNITNVSHNAIKSKECQGTPLNTAWTFWFDR